VAYTNVEQIFMDILGGRLPSPAEQREIDSLLGIVQRAGFVINDPSNAAHITMLAWSWARETGRSDVLAALHNNRQDIDAKITAIHQGIQQQREIIDMVREMKDCQPPSTAPFDTESVAAELAKSLRQSIKPDSTILKTAILESISKLWLIIIGISLVLSFWLGMELAQYQQIPSQHIHHLH
jgi:hypothetical protein